RALGRRPPSEAAAVAGRAACPHRGGADSDDGRGRKEARPGTPQPETQAPFHVALQTRAWRDSHFQLDWIMVISPPTSTRPGRRGIKCRAGFFRPVNSSGVLRAKLR